jgi:hypothetical protein
MKANNQRQALLLGLGLDNQDRHVRLTKGDEFLLVGGSQDTHERMQETAVRFTEELSKRGQRITDLSAEEFADIARHVHRRD